LSFYGQETLAKPQDLDGDGDKKKPWTKEKEIILHIKITFFPGYLDRTELCDENKYDGKNHPTLNRL